MTDEARAVVATANMIDSARQLVVSLAKHKYLTKKDTKSGVALLELILMNITLWQWYEEQNPLKRSMQLHMPMLARHWLKTQAEMSETFLQEYDRLLSTRIEEYCHIKNAAEADIGKNMAEAVYKHMKRTEQIDYFAALALYQYVIGFMKQIDSVWQKLRNA